MSNPSVDINVEIKPSFEEIGNKFEKINIRVPTQQALEQFAFLTERFSKLNSPVDTGRLRASIATDIGDLRAKIAPHVNYAIFVHEGTRFMKGRPFMSIGLDQAEIKLFNGKSPFHTAIEKALDEGLK